MVHIILKIFIFISFAFVLFSEENIVPGEYSKQIRDVHGGYSSSFDPSNILFTVGGSKSRFLFNEPIFIKFKVKNTGFYPVSIYLHNNYLRNFLVSIVDSTGRLLTMKKIDDFDYSIDEQDEYNRNYSATTHFSRVILLKPNESFERVIDIRELVEFPTNNNTINRLVSFNIRAYFYPNPEQVEDFFIKSQHDYSIYLETSHIETSTGYEPPMQFLTQSKVIDPQEVVFLALSAEYTSKWSNFFKYISLHDFVKDYPDYSQQYVQSSDSLKPKVLESFRNYLISDKHNKLHSFEFVTDREIKFNENDNTTITTVKVKIIRKVDGFNRPFLCKYFLTKIDNFWLITGLEAKALN